MEGFLTAEGAVRGPRECPVADHDTQGEWQRDDEGEVERDQQRHGRSAVNGGLLAPERGKKHTRERFDGGQCMQMLYGSSTRTGECFGAGRMGASAPGRRCA